MENKQLNLSEPENIMGTMDVNPLLIKLSIPMMISMLVQALYNVVDSIFVARVSENALTAVSLAFSLQNLMFAVGIGTGVGVNALLSKSLGEKNQYRANKTAENGLFLALCSYLVFLVLGLTVVRPYFYAQTADADIAEQGIRYLTICCVLSLGMFMQVMNEKLLAATSRTTLSMISQLVGAVVNIILDPIFIFGYCGEALSGTTGAALATVIGQFCGAGVSFYLNLRKNPDIQLDFKGFRPSAEAIKRIYVVGLPSIAMQCVGSVMTFLMNQILMAFTATAVAVFGVYFKLQSFVFMPIFGMNNGMVPIIGYNYGARNQIDYDIPEIQYGLSHEFLETSLNNPYLSSGIPYGLSGGSATTVYPESDFSNSSIISGGSLIEVPYQPSVTITDLKQKDGSIGKVSIDRVSLSCKVYEGATDSSMSKGAGHYTSSGIYTGNIGLFGHNRGSHAYFAKLKNVKIGDIVEYKTAIGTKTYQVNFCRVHLLYRLFDLNEMGDNRITLITCIANQPSLRLCVQAVEIR